MILVDDAQGGWVAVEKSEHDLAALRAEKGEVQVAARGGDGRSPALLLVGSWRRWEVAGAAAQESWWRRESGRGEKRRGSRRDV